MASSVSHPSIVSFIFEAISFIEVVVQLSSSERYSYWKFLRGCLGSGGGCYGSRWCGGCGSGGYYGRCWANWRSCPLRYVPSVRLQSSILRDNFLIPWIIRSKVDLIVHMSLSTAPILVERCCKLSSPLAIIGKLPKLLYHLMQIRKWRCQLDLVLAPTNPERNLQVRKVLESTSKG